MALRSTLRKNSLFFLTLLAVFVGVVLGFILRSQAYPANSLQRRLIHFPGEVFLRGIKFMILPLISSSLITGVAGDSVVRTGAIARRTLFFFFLTTLASVLLGIILVVFVQPGIHGHDMVDKYQADNNNTNSTIPESNSLKLSIWDTLMDVIRNMVPDNFLEMCFQIYRSKIEARSTALTFSMHLLLYNCEFIRIMDC